MPVHNEVSEFPTLNDVAPPPEPEPAPFPDSTPFIPAVDDGVPLVRSRGLVKNRWTAKHYIVLTLALLVAGGLAPARSSSAATSAISSPRTPTSRSAAASSSTFAI